MSGRAAPTDAELVEAVYATPMRDAPGTAEAYRIVAARFGVTADRVREAMRAHTRGITG